VAVTNVFPSGGASRDSQISAEYGSPHSKAGLYIILRIK